MSSIKFGGANDELLKKFVRHLVPGEVLFRQNDLGNTMFIIIQGTIELIENRVDHEFIVGYFSNGEVLGEKAMLSEKPYPRTYGARAKTETTLLEFETREVKIVEGIIPNFTTRILQIAAQRLDRANRLIKVLRPTDAFQRFVAAIHFFSEDGEKSADGTEVALTIAAIEEVAAIDLELIEQCVAELFRLKIARKTKTGFTIADPQAVDQAIAEFKERVAA